jgi:biopolymer transport protein ExbD
MSERPLNRFDQPIEIPGRRLGTQVPLRIVRAAMGGGRSRSMNFELPLIPFIDFLLCIVLFLLASFSATGEPLDQPIRAPRAVNTLALVEAPVVAIVGTQLLVDGAPVGGIQEIQEAHRLQSVPALREALGARRNLWRQINPGVEFPGTVLLHADGEVSALVVKSVFQTAAAAGYPNVSFVVRRAGG